MAGEYNDSLINELTTFFIPRRTAEALFSAYVSANINNVTGDGTAYTIIYDTEVSDVFGNYNNATGVFTAPVTSKGYLLVANVVVHDVGVAHTFFQAYIVTSNRSYMGPVSLDPSVGSGGFFSGEIVAIADMDAADTAYVVVQVSNGAKTVDVSGNATTCYNRFEGYMLT